MKNINKNAFTLVELIVVMTILIIISVVAYTSYSGVKGKAYITKKINDISSISNALVNYKIKNNYYPKIEIQSSTNMWGYSGTTTAMPSNTIQVIKTGNAINSILMANGGGKVYGTGSDISIQIGGKGTISQKTLGKQFLSEDLYDPELGDIKLDNGIFIDKGIGKYVYAIYKKNFNNTKGSSYNLAYTVMNKDDVYITKLSGDYDPSVCRISINCPETLIGSGTSILTNKEIQSSNSTINSNQGIPYPVTDFAQ